MNLYPVIQPFLRTLDPETAHRLTIWALKAGLAPTGSGPDPASLRIKIFGLDFPNPIGMAAGFDKNAEVPDALLRLGFGFAEIGSVTPRPQPGNPRPRIFRLPDTRALINRLGFNNEGHAAVKKRLAARRRGAAPGIVGVNLGANKDSTDRIADYVTGIATFEGLADYVTINISSPNTPGLRGLQTRAALEELIARILAARRGNVPVLLKIAPDLEPDDMSDIAALVRADKGRAHNIDGLIISNTTIKRQGLVAGRHTDEAGGLSGAPLFDLSTRILKEMYRLTGGQVPLIGVGGVSSGADAYAKIRSGASLIQLYTALTYQGPALVARIKRDLAACLARDGFTHIADAVGVDVDLGHQSEKTGKNI